MYNIVYSYTKLIAVNSIYKDMSFYSHRPHNITITADAYNSAREIVYGIYRFDCNHIHHAICWSKYV